MRPSRADGARSCLASASLATSCDLRSSCRACANQAGFARWRPCAANLDVFPPFDHASGPKMCREPSHAGDEGMASATIFRTRMPSDCGPTPALSLGSTIVLPRRSFGVASRSAIRKLPG